MLFENRYPDSPVGTIIEFEGDQLVRTAKLQLCWDNCGRSTYWTSSSFACAPLCSEECCRNKWNEYFEAMRKT